MAGLVNGTQDESDLSVPEGAQLPTNEMVELALKNLSPDCTILNVGCGNSNLAMDLHLDGFQNILSVDYSSVVIDSLNQQYSDHPSLKFQCVDCRNMPELATNSIDFALDKGTLDAVRILGAQNAEAMLSEICRVLVRFAFAISFIFALCIC
jgi:ubiquinone/menaquinone biosynthesis C-methylase UbiE